MDKHRLKRLARLRFAQPPGQSLERLGQHLKHKGIGRQINLLEHRRNPPPRLSPGKLRRQRLQRPS
jgi:hypothetical protein